MIGDAYAQLDSRCRLDWGARGARAAADRGDIVAVVDVLSFSTTAATAVHHGATIYPCAWDDDPQRLAKQHEAEIVVSRADAAHTPGRYSLSPLSFVNAPAGLNIVLPSPNGASCLKQAAHAPYLFCTALVNAKATATVLDHLLSTTSRAVTVVACGERWAHPDDDGRLRFALEDYLGAGAILSPEAEVCAAAFQAAQPHLEYTLLHCGSGIELSGNGFEADVRHAAKLNCFDAVAVFRNDALSRYRA